ncbi:MAG: Asp-tRNA(Asn)/Glu-tRNA(Gln) amidotransferase subunit GatB [Burkholderiaceae bacterium]|nr:MAG: Asp-tRNA(Asn)/Glu-tRNA(Gln) amidotransferase subunit GatB [Burkholderiaceae bacterium]
MAAYEPVMGLEVHVELGTATKMFCGCPTVFGADPNTQVCPVCLGLPGALPVVNEKGVESAIRIGLALNCEIASWCRFARKNYFYPDMPKNFQTSQYDEPIAFGGHLDVELEDGTVFRVEIERAHMEEDTGKSLHVGGATGRIHGATHSLVDYNRAGIPLIEIVTKPMVGAGERAPEIARAYVATLRDLLRALDVSDVKMEQGSMRCDVNVSLRPKGTETFGTRTETKNVNSLRSVERAVRYEMQRHAAVLSSGGSIVQETRHWHHQALLMHVLLSLVGLLAEPWRTKALDLLLAGKATGVATTVPGPPAARYLAGARITDMMFWVPQAGDIGFGVSFLSYDGSLRVGVMSDATRLADPQPLVERLVSEFERLQPLARMMSTQD